MLIRESQTEQQFMLKLNREHYKHLLFSFLPVGFYMTVLKSNSTQNEVAQLLTPEFTSATEMCFRFWWVQRYCSMYFSYCILASIQITEFCIFFCRYWLPVGSSNILAVHVLQSWEWGNALWQRSGAPSTAWEVAEVTVSSPTKFHVRCFVRKSLSLCSSASQTGRILLFYIYTI